MLTKELTPKQAARILGVSVMTIHNMLNDGRIKGARRPNGTSIRIPADQIDDPRGRLVALQEAYDTLEDLLDTAIRRGDLDNIRAFREALVQIKQFWNDPLSIDLRNVLRVLIDAPSDRLPLAKIITVLGDAFECN